eukprot:scaffold235393_cov36-Tisochrysis_lutea.AAC.1
MNVIVRSLLRRARDEKLLKLLAARDAMSSSIASSDVLRFRLSRGADQTFELPHSLRVCRVGVEMIAYGALVHARPRHRPARKEDMNCGRVCCLYV